MARKLLPWIYALTTVSSGLFILWTWFYFITIFPQKDVPVYLDEDEETGQANYAHEPTPNYIMKHVIFQCVLLIFISTFWCMDVCPYSKGEDKEEDTDDET